MKTAYIYSVSRTNALREALLSKTDIERLMVAGAGEDLQSALKETYLAPYLLRTDSEDMVEAIEATLIEAKKLVHKIAPKGDMFRPLWVQYDVHNLRVLAKANAKNLGFEDVVGVMSRRGIYEPHELYKRVETEDLNSLQPGWQSVFAEALQLIEEKQFDQIDTVFDTLYFATSRRIAEEKGDAFIKKFVATLIDMHNLKGRLRTLRYPQLEEIVSFVEGGSVTKDQLVSEDTVLKAFARCGVGGFWKEAVDYYIETGNSTRLDARIDEYLLDLAQKDSRDSFTFTSSSLVSYYLLCRQSAANVRTIVVGKNSGMNEADIRANLRMAYVKE